MTGKIYNKIVVVNERNEIIGVENLSDAIAKGMIRRAASVWVFNESGQVLLQKRGGTVLEPYKYDQSVGGHVDDGESSESTARREMVEEILLTEVELVEITPSLRVTGFFLAVYKAIIADDRPVSFNPEEVDSLRWVTVSELDKMMQVTPDQFTPTCRDVWRDLRDKLIV